MTPFSCSTPIPFSVFFFLPFSCGCGTVSDEKRPPEGQRHLVYTTRMRENGVSSSKCKFSLPWDGAHPHPDPPPIGRIAPSQFRQRSAHLDFRPPPRKQGDFASFNNSPPHFLVLNNSALASCNNLSSHLLVRKQGTLAVGEFTQLANLPSRLIMAPWRVLTTRLLAFSSENKAPWRVYTLAFTPFRQG